MLSRFDLLFIILDEISAEHDRTIADHVLRIHRYKGQNDDSLQDQGMIHFPAFTNLDSTSDDLNDKEEQEATPVFQKFDRLLHGNKKKQEIYSIPFIKKFILYAKTRITPVLSEEVLFLYPLNNCLGQFVYQQCLRSTSK